MNIAYIPLTNLERSARAINQREKRTVTYSTNRGNEVSKIFIISLRLIGSAGKENFQI